tara:strand:+ start:21430 stop:22221 length:792 start_codon:yes stop_codon:yes gene_type:complete
MAFDLSNIVTGVVKKPKISVLYGLSGLGKTTSLSKLPDVFMIPVEEGANEIDVPKMNFGTAEKPRFKADSFQEVMDTLGLCAGEGFPFKNVVIDSISELEILIHKKVCQDNNVVSLEKIDYGKGYKFAMEHWLKFFTGVEYLRNSCDVGIWMVAHSDTNRFNDPEGEAYDYYAPQLRKEPMEYIVKNVDAIFFLTKKKAIRKVDAGFNNKDAKAVDMNQRVIYTNQKVTHIAKNRAQPSLPDEMPLDINLIMDMWNNPEKYSQ